MSGQIVRKARVGDRCVGQCLCVHTHTPMPVSRSLQSLSPVSLSPLSSPPQAERDCQGPLCKSLEHSEHSISQRPGLDGFQSHFTAAWSVCFSCLPWSAVHPGCGVRSWPLRLQRAHRAVQPRAGSIWERVPSSLIPFSINGSCFTGSLGIPQSH